MLLSETSSDACKAAACNSDDTCERTDKHGGGGARVPGEVKGPRIVSNTTLATFKVTRPVYAALPHLALVAID